MAFETAVDLLPQRTHVGQRPRGDGVRQAGVHVDAPARRHFGRQRLEVAHHHGRLVDVDALNRQARDALRQLGRLGEHAQAQGVGVQAGQLGRVGVQVPADDLVLVGRVLGQRPHHGNAAALRRDHARDMQKGARIELLGRQAHFVQHLVFLAQAEGKFKQLGLALADQPRQRDGGAHIAECVMGLVVQQAVGAGQVLELEAGAAVFLAGPLDALGAQGVDHAHHIQQVPATAVVLPFARIGVDQVAPEQEARHLVVKADGVVAHADGARLGEGGFDLARKGVLGQALLQALLGGDAGDQAGFGAGQVVRRGLAIAHQRLADLVELQVRADGRELRGPVIAGVGTKGFVVVPEEGVFSHAASMPHASFGQRESGLRSIYLAFQAFSAGNPYLPSARSSWINSIHYNSGEHSRASESPRRCTKCWGRA